jgi:VIT1/CCC1 family predicted Fe2+/Mn2+ transporter
LVPTTPHVEKHFTSSDAVRDVVIGMSDGLTVPFALAAGLTGAIAQSRLIVTAGFAEIYAHEVAREQDEITRIPEAEAKEVADIFRSYGLSDGESSSVVQSLRQRPKDWVAFMMRFELGLEEPQPSRAWKSALTIALAYAVGGIIPLSAYLLLPDARAALRLSVIVTLIALAVFGGVKGKFTGVPVLRSALQTSVIGGLAAVAAFGIARWIS